MLYKVNYFYYFYITRGVLLIFSYKFFRKETLIFIAPIPPMSISDGYQWNMHNSK